MLLPLIAVVVLAAAWSCYWFVALVVAKDIAGKERQKLEYAGYTLACRDEGWRGYPFRIEFTCSSPRVTVEANARVASVRLSAVALAYNPWHVILLLDGPTNIESVGGRRIELTHGRIAGSFKVKDGLIASASFEFPRASAPELFNAGMLLVHWKRSLRDATDVALSFDDLVYRTTAGGELVISHGELTGSITANSRLHVQNFDLQEGPVRYWGSGFVEIDSTKTLAGKISTETNDLGGLLDIIEPHLLMSDQQKTSFRLAMGLLGQKAKTDILASNGELFIGPFKIADLLPLY